MPSITSSPMDTRTPPMTSGSTTTLRCTGREYCAASASCSRCCVLAAAGRGRPGRWRPAACGARPRSSGRSRAPPTTVRCVPTTACSASRTVAEVALPSSRSSSSRRLSATLRAGSRERVAQLAGSRRRAARTRTARSRGRRPCPSARRRGRPRRRPRCSRASPQVAASRAQRRPAAAATRSADAGSICSPKMPRSSPALASGGDRHVGRDPAQAGLAAQHLGDAEQVVADPSTRPRRPRPPHRGPRSARGASRRRRPASAAPRSRAPRRPSAGSRGRRGSARRRGAGEPRPPATHPTMRPAREVASEPTSAAERGDRLLALGLDLGVRVLDDARRLGLRLLAHLRDDRRTLLARLLADARRLVPGVAELLLELGQLGVGLGLLGLGRLAGRPRWRPSGRRRSSRSSGRPTS